MSESIEFPLNFERFMAMGNEALEEGKLAEAQTNFEEAYNLKADFQANQALVKLLMARSNFQEASKIATEMLTDYLKTEEDLHLYITLLIGNHEFIRAHKLINTLELTGTTLLTEINEAENFFRKFKQGELRTLQEKANELSQLNFYQQAQVLRALESLPKTEYVAVTKKVLATGQLFQLLTTTLLETLVILKAKGLVKIPTLTEGNQMIGLEELTVTAEQASYQQALSYLLAGQEQQDSELTQQLSRELHLHYSLLYPLGDDLIKLPELWVDLYLKEYLGQEKSNADFLTKEAATYRQILTLIKTELGEMSV